MAGQVSGSSGLPEGAEYPRHSTALPSAATRARLVEVVQLQLHSVQLNIMANYSGDRERGFISWVVLWADGSEMRL